MYKRVKGALLILLCLVLDAANAQLDFRFADANRPDSFSIPFTISNSLIQVEVSVNGKDEKFVLDNGAPYLVINTRHWGSPVAPDSLIKARGVGGKVTAGAVKIDSFNWQGIRKSNFKAISADLPLLGDSICGLLGVDLYKDYRVTFDWGNNRILFARPGLVPIDTTLAVVKLPASFALHMPVVAVQIKGDTLQMGVDCGASTCLLPLSQLSLVGQLANFHQTALTGAGTPTTVLAGDIKDVTIKGWPYEHMTFAFDNSSVNQINQVSNTKIDGLLGLPFFKQHKTVIDFPNRRVEIYPEKQ